MKTYLPYFIVKYRGGSTNSCLIAYVHPGSADQQKAQAMKKAKSIERSKYENSCYAGDDDDDNIVFEDFARLRLNEPDE